MPTPPSLWCFVMAALVSLYGLFLHNLTNNSIVKLVNFFQSKLWEKYSFNLHCFYYEYSWASFHVFKDYFSIILWNWWFEVYFLIFKNILHNIEITIYLWHFMLHFEILLRVFIFFNCTVCCNYKWVFPLRLSSS